MQEILLNPWKVLLHERPIMKNLEFFLKNRRVIKELPIVVVEHNGNYIQIDGVHRIVSARRLGIQKMPAIVLSFEEYKRFVIIKSWYGYTNRPLVPGNLELGKDYVVEEFSNGRWVKRFYISERQYLRLIDVLKFSTNALEGYKYRVRIAQNLSHEDVVKRALEGIPYPPKTTAHFIKMNGRLYHIEVIEKNEELRRRFISTVNVSMLTSRNHYKRRRRKPLYG